MLFMQNCTHAAVRFHQLTHWGLNKMADILPATSWDAFPWMKISLFPLQTHLFISKFPIDSKSVLV